MEVPVGHRWQVINVSGSLKFESSNVTYGDLQYSIYINISIDMYIYIYIYILLYMHTNIMYTRMHADAGTAPS